MVVALRHLLWSLGSLPAHRAHVSKMTSFCMKMALAASFVRCTSAYSSFFGCVKQHLYFFADSEVENANLAVLSSDRALDKALPCTWFVVVLVWKSYTRMVPLCSVDGRLQEKGRLLWSLFSLTGGQQQKRRSFGCGCGKSWNQFSNRSMSHGSSRERLENKKIVFFGRGKHTF